jgi:hypothetical protein
MAGNARRNGSTAAVVGGALIGIGICFVPFARRTRPRNPRETRAMPAFGVYAQWLSGQMGVG